MTIDWPILLAASLAVLFPVTFFISGEKKDYLSDHHLSRFRLEKGLAAWQNWVDFGRALAGFYLLREFAIVLETDGDFENAFERNMDFLLIVGVALIGLVLQTVHYRKVFYCLAPVFYLWGMTFALSHWIPAAFALVFGTLIGRTVDSVELKLSVTMVLLLVTGYFSHHFDLMLIVNAGLLLVPIILCWIFRTSSPIYYTGEQH